MEACSQRRVSLLKQLSSFCQVEKKKKQLRHPPNFNGPENVCLGSGGAQNNYLPNQSLSYGTSESVCWSQDALLEFFPIMVQLQQKF